VFAKAYFAGKREMIERAEAIAIVEIVETEEVKQRGTYWTYSQKAMGIVKESFKGDIQGNIVIYGMEDFICAQCRFEKGLFLLFLRKEDNNFWVGSNWQVGIRSIKDDKVDWLKNDTSPFETEQKPLKEVILEIQNVLKENKNET
jgi:hypothetical protein